VTTKNLEAIARAAEDNGWKVIALVDFPDAAGRVPNGIAAIERERSPFGADRRYATARWYVQPDYAGFESGNYDMTREAALSDFAERGYIATKGEANVH
jgi:hypothetical protein